MDPGLGLGRLGRSHVAGHVVWASNPLLPSGVWARVQKAQIGVAGAGDVHLDGLFRRAVVGVCGGDAVVGGGGGGSNVGGVEWVGVESVAVVGLGRHPAL